MEGLTEEETGLVLMGGAMLSKSLIQFSVEWVELCSLPAIYLVQTILEVMKIMALPSKDPMHVWLYSVPQPCSRPPLTHASAGDSWTLTGKSESVSYGVTASFSLVLVHTSFCVCPPRV